MELEAQEDGYIRMNLLCETGKPIPVSVSWEIPDDTSFMKAVQKALLRETLASWKSSVVAVLSFLLLTAGDCHLGLPRENGNERISEYLKPNDGT